MTTFVITDGDGKIACEVEAGGRKKALAVAQRKWGGMLHGTGGFYDALVGHTLAGFAPLRALTKREHAEKFGT